MVYIYIINFYYILSNIFLIIFNNIFLDAPIDIPKYKYPANKHQETDNAEPLENTNNIAESANQDIDKLRVNLFSGWGEDSNKADDNTADKVERNPQDVIVNYSSDISSEVEMLDSSTAHIE